MHVIYVFNLFLFIDWLKVCHMFSNSPNIFQICVAKVLYPAQRYYIRPYIVLLRRHCCLCEGDALGSESNQAVRTRHRRPAGRMANSYHWNYYVQKVSIWNKIMIILYLHQKEMPWTLFWNEISTADCLLTVTLDAQSSWWWSSPMQNGWSSYQWLQITTQKVR